MIEITDLLKSLDSIQTQFKIDVLAISCCKHRLDKSPNFQKRNIVDPVYTTYIQPCDIEASQSIRDYYGKKLIVATLMEEKISPFRKALKDFLAKDGTAIQNDEMGIAHKLPEFYEYDIAIDAIVEDSVTVPNATQLVVGTKELKLVTKLVRKTQRVHKIDYWFKDSADHLCLLKVEGENSLDGVFTKLVNKNTTSRFSANYMPRAKGKLTYFEMKSWDLLLD